MGWKFDKEGQEVELKILLDDEGVPLGLFDEIDFVGEGVSAALVGSKATVTVDAMREVFHARLSLVDATHINLGAYKGHVIHVKDELVLVPLVSLAIADSLIDGAGADTAAGMVADTLYYIYASNSQAAFAPTELRGSAVAPSFVDGVLYLAGAGNALNWRYVGMVKTTGANEFVDSVTQRFVINYYNTRGLALRSIPAYNDNNALTQGSTASVNWVEANGGVNSRLEFLSHGEDAVSYSAQGYGYPTVADLGNIGVGEDSITQAARKMNLRPNVGSLNGNSTPAMGYHYLSLLIAIELVDGAGFNFIYDNARLNGDAADAAITGIQAIIQG